MKKKSYQLLLTACFVFFFAITMITARQLDLETILGSIFIALIESLIFYLITIIFRYMYNRSKLRVD